MRAGGVGLAHRARGLAAALRADPKARVAFTSLCASVLLAGLKLAVGLGTGSLGILSEALHSTFDLLAAALTYVAVRAAAKPPDAEHRYGHGKAESVAALVETLLLLGTSGWIVVEALRRLLWGGREVEVTLAAFGVMAVSVAVDFSRMRALSRAARVYRSQALAADALHFQSDILSSAVVILGLGATAAGFPAGDPLAAIGVALLVTVASLRLGRRTLDVLMDRAPESLVRAIEADVRRLRGVLRVERLRVRAAGADTFVDMTLALDRSLPFEAAHAIADEAERIVRRAAPGADVVIHTEPLAGPAESAATRVRLAALALPGVLDVHEVEVVDADEGLAVSAHITLDGRLPLAEAHAVADAMEAAVRRVLPGVGDVRLHIDSHVDRTRRGRDVTAARPALVA
ncbi:MAG TPA: cation-efflux pump, partial [Thermodesulfobacteriota bacterium]|nr:cation-efflux pump [Thermodesulfobacteriota bacterium]